MRNLLGSKLWIFMLAVVLALGIGLAISCGGDDDDDSGDDDAGDDDIFDDDDSGDDDSGDDDSGDDDDDCDDNTAPELLSANYVVNGNFIDPPINIDPEDEFGIYFEYNDDDCNLPGGEFWLNYDGAGYEAFPDPLPADLGCSTAQSGLVYGFSLQNPIDEGAHTFAVYWTDVCDEQSNEITGDFTVTAAD